MNRSLLPTTIQVCIVSPGLLEALTDRGGGIEEIEYRVGLELSKNFVLTIISPFYRRFKRKIRLNHSFSIDEVYLPATKNYPPGSQFEVVMNFLKSFIFCSLCILKIIPLKKKGLKIIILSDKILGLPLIFISKLLGIRIIFSEGNLDPWVWHYLSNVQVSYLRIFSRSLSISLGKLVCYFSDRIHVQSELILVSMIKLGINPAKIKVIGPGIDTKAFAPLKSNDNILPSPFKVGFIGRLTDDKGVSSLLEVIKKAEFDLPNVKFLIMGDGPYRGLLEKSPNVCKVGFVPHNCLPNVLSEVSVVLFFQKDIGLAELEAMACGKVIIALNTGKIPHIIQHLKNGILCSLNASSYINALKNTQDHNLLNQLSRNARETAINNFSWTIAGERWTDFVSGVLEKTAITGKVCDNV